MKYCVAQLRPAKADIKQNVQGHLRLIELASAYKPDIIVFPELSLTGYEPSLADNLAMDIADPALGAFQKISNLSNIVITAGAPVRVDNDLAIGMFVFQPDQAIQIYTKTYLHSDEAPFFKGKQGITGVKISSKQIAFAICYEVSVDVHAERAVHEGAGVYMASVAKSAAGIDKADKSLAEIAEKYSMTVLMSNAVGPCDNFVCAGRSAAWNALGEKVGELDDRSEGLLIFDDINNGVTRVQF